MVEMVKLTEMVEIVELAEKVRRVQICDLYKLTLPAGRGTNVLRNTSLISTYLKLTHFSQWV